MVKTTQLRNEYLNFIRQYIAENHCAPRLEEVAQRFYVTEPTAHKMLSLLQDEGYLYFDRDDYSGFYIRLVEKIGTAAPITEIVIAGGFDRYGKLHEFPKKHGHFPLVLPGYYPQKMFALQAWQHIPAADILANDLLICLQNPEPRCGQICIITLSQEMILARLISQDQDGRFIWEPTALGENTKDFFEKYLDDYLENPHPIDKGLILASVIAMKRLLTI